MQTPRAPRTIAFDEGPFTFDDETVPVVGVMTRGALVVEAVVVGAVTVDGWDATEEVLRLVGRLPGSGPDLVLIDGVTLGGMNLVDLPRIAAATGRPALGVTRDRPERERMLRAVQKARDPDRRLLLLPPDPPVEVHLGGRPLYIQPAGVALAHGALPDALVAHLQATLHEANIPEPLRLAHHIATALVRGVSGTSA